MGSTYCNLHYHWVCSTKERRPLIRAWRPQLHEYLGGTIRGLDGSPLIIGGIEDHVHALIGLKTTHCVADFVREIKKALRSFPEVCATLRPPATIWHPFRMRPLPTPRPGCCVALGPLAIVELPSELLWSLEFSTGPLSELLRLPATIGRPCGLLQA